MAEIGGFWSYVHADDDADGGRITQLARDVRAQYEMLTGDSIRLFLDRDDIEWGDEWKSKIDVTLQSVVFFVAVLTPRYFRSVECRRELNLFARRAARVGMNELVLPILYVDFPALHEDPCPDDAITLAKSLHWVDWTDARFKSVDSPEYRQAVVSLAQRLVAASASAERVETTDATVEAIQSDENDSGFIDKLARMEEAMPELAAAMDGIAREIAEISDITNAAAAKMQRGDAQGKGFAARLAVLNEIAQDLDEPVMRVVELSNKFTRQLNDIDLGVKIIIERMPREIEENPDSLILYEPFITSFRQVIEQAELGLGQMQAMAEVIEPVEAGSRSVRPVLRKLRKAVTLLAEGRRVTREWDRLFNELDMAK